MTRRSTFLSHARPALCLALSGALAACAGAAERIENIGQAPELHPIASGPSIDPGYTPVRLPMPAPQVAEARPNSLWQPGSRAFFRDNRADKVGDILTVMIEIDDSATINNETERNRTSNEGLNLPNILGLETAAAAILPESFDPDNAVDVGSDSASGGSGSIRRGEKIQLKVAAVVTEMLPNGNMAIYGRQEVRVNFEARDLEIAGVIRPQDITADNTISYEKIAEARISYGGRGQITDVQQPRYGQQLYDILMPF